MSAFFVLCGEGWYTIWNMNIILAIGFAVFGLMIGSFLNVLILRYNTGKGFGGRSECFSCGRKLTARDLFPVLSYLFSGGRCRTCKSRISKQYALVEIATSLLFLAAYFHNRHLLSDFGNSEMIGSLRLAPLVFFAKSMIDCALMSLLVFMAGYDIRHKIIPDAMVFVFAGLALVGSMIAAPVVPVIGGLAMPAGTLTVSGFSWWLLASGPLLALPFYLIWLFSGGRWMGLGDAKLALGFGWMLGLSAGGTAVIFGFWAGAAYAMLVMLLRPDVSLRNKGLFFAGIMLVMIVESSYGVLRIDPVVMLSVAAFLAACIAASRTRTMKKMTRWGYIPALQMKSEVPFAPFLILGLLIVYVLGYNLFIFGI